MWRHGRFGLVQAFDGSAKFGPAYARDFAQAAEALGFHSVWVPEHIVFFEHYESVYPYPPEPGSTAPPQLPVGRRPALFDPLLTCQALALHTTTLRVGTAVALLPLRHPLLWAREVSTLDHFSGGRFELGVGVGWLAEEYAALGVPFHERGRIADEHLAALRALWATDESTFHGRHVDFTDVVELPQATAVTGPADPHRRRERRRPATRRPLRRRLVRVEHDARRARARAWSASTGHLAASFVDGSPRTLDDVTIQVGLRFPGDWTSWPSWWRRTPRSARRGWWRRCRSVRPSSRSGWPRSPPRCRSRRAGTSTGPACR